ncbi:MAG: CRISPR-associated endoribonuclease Cas6 [Cetobacterium sp.]|uniref:CRISPR-associated endoribonuclease Cas6 n=1 Tax=Cetobacterium sp. ZOR0034 TaxID=1339239 RepID=UPI0006466FF9|nr:CRISPR-associated endoribonuclease Cas6 [Cetobacterium sp. ZOR0034]
MRLELNFIVEKNEIPIEFRKTIVSFFKSVIENYDKDLFKSLYDIGKEKRVTFAPFFTPLQFNKNSILLKSNNIKVIFSTEDELLGLHYFNAFLQNLENSYTFKNNKLTLIRAIKIKEKKIENDKAIFKILSPLIIREQLNEDKSWYHLLDEKGIEVLKRNLLTTLKGEFPEKYLVELEIFPLETKKVVTTFYGIKMQGTLGIIEIRGRKEILNSLYKSGALSSRKSMGFGMLDIIE